MTKREQNKAIALHLEWTFHDLEYAHVGGGAVGEKFWLPPGVDITTLSAEEISTGPNHGRDIPDYSGDLNRMREAIAVLKDSPVDFHGRYHSQKTLYTCLLIEVILGITSGSYQWPAFGPSCDMVFLVASATAEQQAEAFIRFIEAVK